MTKQIQKQIVSLSPQEFQKTLQLHFDAGWRIVPNTTSVSASSATHMGEWSRGSVQTSYICTATVESTVKC